MKIQPNGLKLNIEMSFRQFCALEDKGDFSDVEKLLADLPVSEIDYNGHFGCNFWLTIEARSKGTEWEEFTFENAMEVAREVEQRLTKYLKRWKNYKRPGYEHVK